MLDTEYRAEIPSDLDDDVVGWDRDGDLVVEFIPGHYAPLTPCCNASGKGVTYSETGVACRACYVDVDGKYGDSYTRDEVTLREEVSA
jgi:hypothetical protein